MIYKFLKWFAKIGIIFYYKNIFIYYEEPIANNKPFIYTSNHPSGFYESLILATVSTTPPIFLVRSDYVTIKGLMWFFKLLRLYPIYRQSEGLKNVTKNNQVFKELNNELKLNTPITIYPEGTTKFRYNIRSIKKGISRLTVGAIQDGVKNLNILPIAFNFTAPAEFRSYLFINYGHPLKLNNLNDYSENDAIKLKELTLEISDKMKTVAIDIKETKRQNLFQKIQILQLNNELANKRNHLYEYNSDLPKKNKQLSSRINELDDYISSKLEPKALKYFNLLKTTKTNDNAVISKYNSMIDWIKLILGFPIYILSLILNSLPIIIALFIRKNKINKYEYKAVVTVLISQFLYLFYFIILFIIALFSFSYFGLLIVILPFLAWYSLRYYDFSKTWMLKNNLKKSNKKEYLLELRKEICQLIEL
jgi:1-acyl-sn-glycerol-3-phosphate acyltransferase